MMSMGTQTYAMSNLIEDEEVVTEQGVDELAEEDVGPPVLTLETAIYASLDNNRNIELARQAIELTRAYGNASYAGLLPDLSMVFSYTRNHKAESYEVPDQEPIEISSLDNFYGQLAFRYPIWHNGERESTSRGNAAAEEISEQDLVIAEAMIAYAATDAFCTAREGFGGLAVRQASLNHLTELEHQAQAMYDAGYMPLSDLLSVQVAKAMAEIQVLEWSNNVITRMTSLNLIMGEDVATRWTLIPIDYPIIEIPFSQELLTQWALENRPELKQIKAEREQLLAQMDGIRSSTGPNVDFEAVYSQRSSGGLSDMSESLSGSINVWWDLYNFGRTDDLIAPLEEQLVMLDIREEEQEEQIRSEVESAMLSLQTQLGNVNVTARAVVQSEEAMRVSQRRMEEGLGLMVEVLDSQATWTQLGAGSVFATHMYYRLLAVLSGAVGVNPIDMVTLIEASGGSE